MTDDQDKINQLLEKLEFLLRRQEDFSKEIENLRAEILHLKNQELEGKIEDENVPDRPVVATDFEIKEEITSENQETQQQVPEEPSGQNIPTDDRSPKEKSDLEKFIGENLINKIGIAITVIGVAIGAKYSIEHNLISPLTRIILGYLFGLGMLGIGIKLKTRYENYSAVLVSGALAIMYFITFFAYGLYNLIPQLLAFLLMSVLTVFTVTAAINYNRQIIAHIGLVGAYAVPFLLSDGSGKAAILFSYVAIINIGILAMSIKKYWKPLYYVSLGLTWLIFYAWYDSTYQPNDYFGVAFVSISVFFVIFYITFLAYKLHKEEKFVIDDIILLLFNSFVFYGLGYSILENHPTGSQLLGLFTLITAIVHFVVSVIIYRQKQADKSIHYLIAGLVLVFITITIPVQLNGNWVTSIWAIEAALLFWIGRTKNVSFYEVLSYPLMLLAFFSIFHDWNTVYNSYIAEFSSSRITPIANVNFLTSIIFIASFVFINLLNRRTTNSSQPASLKNLFEVFEYVIPTILISIIYFAFRMEIANYWDQLYTDSLITINSEDQEYPQQYWNYDLYSFKSVWLLNFSLLFIAVLSFVNLRKVKNRELGLLNLGLIVIVIFLFLTEGLINLSALRVRYLQQTLSEYYNRSAANLCLRYISFSLVALTLYSCYKYIKEEFTQNSFKLAFEFLLHTTIIWIASNELNNWLEIFETGRFGKLALSILWGIYALFLIVFGIRKKNKPLRIGAFTLFGITLIKLFIYDISHLNTIAKTIVFVSLGILLLIVSFLYHKNKHFISNDEAAN